MSVKVSAVSEAIRPKYSLYPYQRQVLGDLLRILGRVQSGDENIGRRVVAHLPTGAGKTRIACHAAATLLNAAEAEGQIVVWMASTEELCEQAAEGLIEAWSYLGNRDVQLHRHWGTNVQSLVDLDEGFLVAGLPKLWGTAQTPGALRHLADRVAGVIFDEAHQSVAHTYRFITEQLVTYEPPLLGLTATPGRSMQIGREDYKLADMFHRNKVTIDSKGHDSPVAYLIKQGYLAEPDFSPVTVKLEARVPEPKADLDYAHSDLDRIGQDAVWQEMVLDLSLKALRRYKRVMVFCPSVPCAEKTALEVSAYSIRACSITARTPSEQRQKAIQAFRAMDNAAMAIFNYGVLTAGFDAPRTRCVIIARPTTSLVLYSQMVGRAMRGPRSGGNRQCQIYTVVDTNLRGFGSVVEAFNNWETLWQ